MRTTVDLAPEVLERARRLADQRRQSLPTTLGDLVILGLASLGQPTMVSNDPVSGLPTLTLGHRVTAAEVAEALDGG